MEKVFFDFDKLFEEYVRDKLQRDKTITPSTIKEQLDKLYHEWSITPSEQLGMLSPSQYFSDISSPEILINFLQKSCENGRAPNSFLTDRICAVADCAQYLRRIIAESRNSALIITAIGLLERMSAEHPLAGYVEILRDNYSDADLCEEIVSVLVENADKVSELLYEIIPSAGDALKTIIAEVLTHARKDDRTFELLLGLFYESDNIPLIAWYIGRYGDERFCPVLYKALDRCNYVEYVEIKNAIERMGGIVEDTKDFSEDYYYKIIKQGHKTSDGD